MKCTCGKELREVYGKYSRFWGCVSYPDCCNKFDYLEKIEIELKKVKEYNWLGKKQGDISDKITNFIYNISSYEELIKKFELEDLDAIHKNYAMARWYNYWSAKATEYIFSKNNRVKANKNEKDKLIDFYIDGIKFDHKGTVFPSAFSGKGKVELIKWLYKNQSCQRRFHESNRLFVVFYAKNGEHWRLKSEIQNIKKEIENYLKEFDRKKLTKIIFYNGNKALSDIIVIKEQ